MKKSLLLFCALLGLMLISSTTYAQSVIPSKWLVPATKSWFGNASNNVRGMAYNAVTNHVLVASREAGINAIIILDAATGDSLGKLNMSGIDTTAATGGTFLFNRVAISGDGKIYASNLQVSLTAIQKMKIYQWDNETSPARVAYVDGDPQLKWSVPAGVPWMNTSGDLVRGVALSVDGSKLYVASRETGYNTVVIINTVNGDTIGRLDNTGISGGDNIVSRIGVSGDGKVYLCNLRVTPTKVNTFKVYYYASDTSKPVVAFSDSVYGRQGDAMAVVGSGANTYVYVGGNGSPAGAGGTFVHIFKASTDNNDTLSFVRAVKADGYSGALGLGPTTAGLGSFWINTSGRHAALYDTSGIKLDSIQGTALGTGITTAKPVTIFGTKYVAGYDYVSKKGVLADMRFSGINAQTALVTPASGTNTNVNGTGEVLYNSKDSTIIVFGTNNGIYVYSLRTLLPGVRQGDALAVSGTGSNRYLYLSGNTAIAGGTYVNAFYANTDTTLVLYKSIFMNAYPGVLGFGPTVNGFGKMWLNRSGNPAILYDTTGLPLDTISTGIVSSGASTSHYFEYAGRKFVAMYSGNTTPSVFRVVDVTNGGAASNYLVAVSSSLGVNTNANGTGEAIYSSVDSSLYLFSTNNGVGKFSISLSTPGVTFSSRVPFVPNAGENDTVYFNLLSMKAINTAQLAYYGNKTIVSDQNGIDSANASLDQFNGRVYRSIVPASINRNGRRINFRADVTDAVNVKSSVSVPGYFAGITKLAYIGGPREIDTNGVILHKGYGIRSQGVVIVEDSVFQVANSEIVLQDSLGGVTVFKSGTPFDVKRGNAYIVTGTTDNPTGGGSKFQFVDPGITFTDLGPAPQPVMPKVVTIKELITNGELLENSLIIVRNVTKTVSSLAWPAAGASQNMTFIDGSGDSTTMRIDSDTDIDGTPEPSYPITIVGDAGQFDNTLPYKSGYQWLPREMKDIFFMPTLQALNFEAPNFDYTFTDFSGAKAVRVPNPQKNGLDTSNFVVKMVKGAGDPWAGSYLSLNKPIDFKNTKLFKVKVFMPKVGAKLLLKFENQTNGAFNMEKEATGTKANAWEELMYDFSAIDTSKTYQKVVLICDLGTVGDGSANFTYLLDDIQPYIAPVVPMGVTLTTGKIQTTVTNVGHIGGVSAFQDKVGFKVGGTERLFEGSLIFTTDSAHVSNAWRDRAGDYSPGFRPLRNIKVDVVGAQTRTETMFDDSNMVRPLGISVLQRALVDTTPAKAGYLMMQLNVINNSNAALSKLKVGTFLDFDMTAAGNVDRGGIIRDSTNTIPSVNSGLPFKMYVAYQQAGGVNTAFAGFVSVSQGQFGGGRIASGTLEVYPTFTDSLKNNYVSIFRSTNTFTDNGKNDDQSIVASVGAFNINSKDTAKIAFAVISGNSLGDLIATARQAQKDYAALDPFGPATKVEKSELPVTFALDQNYPNPFNPTTTIRFALPSNSLTKLVVYDVLGREVRTLINNNTDAGYHEIVWNGRNNLGSQVASGMYIYRIESGSFISTKKMMLLK